MKKTKPVGADAPRPRVGEDRPIDAARLLAERFMRLARVATAREREVLINYLLADHGFGVSKTIQRSRRYRRCGDALALLEYWHWLRKLAKNSSTNAEARLELVADLEQLERRLDKLAKPVEGGGDE
jgi:hypothetical protein